VTAIKLTAGELITSSAQIANGIIISAKIGHLEVDTINVKDGAITDVAYAYSPAVEYIDDGVPSGHERVLQTLTITAPSTGYVKLQMACNFYVFLGDYVTWIFRIYRGSTLVRSINIGDSSLNTTMFNATLIDNPTPGSDVTYTLRVYKNGPASVNASAEDRLIIAERVKK